jgi:hypothetical protein
MYPFVHEAIAPNEDARSITTYLRKVDVPAKWEEFFDFLQGAICDVKASDNNDLDAHKTTASHDKVVARRNTHQW